MTLLQIDFTSLFMTLGIVVIIVILVVAIAMIWFELKIYQWVIVKFKGYVESLGSLFVTFLIAVLIQLGVGIVIFLIEFFALFLPDIITLIIYLIILILEPVITLILTPYIISKRHDLSFFKALLSWLLGSLIIVLIWIGILFLIISIFVVPINIPSISINFTPSMISFITYLIDIILFTLVMLLLISSILYNQVKNYQGSGNSYGQSFLTIFISCLIINIPSILINYVFTKLNLNISSIYVDVIFLAIGFVILDILIRKRHTLDTKLAIIISIMYIFFNALIMFFEFYYFIPLFSTI